MDIWPSFSCSDGCAKWQIFSADLTYLLSSDLIFHVLMSVIRQEKFLQIWPIYICIVIWPSFSCSEVYLKLSNVSADLTYLLSSDLVFHALKSILSWVKCNVSADLTYLLSSDLVFRALKSILSWVMFLQIWPIYYHLT